MDPISDMLTRIMNAQAVAHERVTIPFSKVKLSIAQLLVASGYLSSVERIKRKARKAEVEYLDVVLKYDAGLGAISGLRIVSSPSRHLYAKATELKPVRSGYGIAVVSTSKGILSSIQAKKEKLGGEVLFEIW